VLCWPILGLENQKNKTWYPHPACLMPSTGVVGYFDDDGKTPARSGENRKKSRAEGLK